MTMADEPALGLVAAHAPLPGAGGARRPVADAGYRRYGIRELNQLNALSELRARFGSSLPSSSRTRLRRSLRCVPPSRPGWPGRQSRARAAHPAWVEWEQRKHERLLVTDAA
jgi:hypothetical protein